jgi:hypothetical protein
MVLLLLVFGALPIIIVVTLKLDLSAWGMFLKDVPIQMVNGLLLSLLFYYWNPDAIRHIKMILWDDFAPDWLHQVNVNRVDVINI